MSSTPAKTPGRDQRVPMERLVRLATVLHHAGKRGVPTERLIEVAGFAGGKDPVSQLAREFRHLRELGWQIDNVGGTGTDGVYRMTSIDNRLRVRLTPGQQTALRRAALAAHRDDLVERLGLPEVTGDLEPGSTVSAAPDTAALSAVTRAVRLGSLLRFRYNGSDRVVHPGTARAQNGTWYLRGREEGGEEEKSFVVSRMIAVHADEPGTATRSGVTRHPGLHPMTWEIDPPVEVVLRAPAEYAADVRRWLLDPIAETTADGFTDLVYRVTNAEALRSRLYELGTRVRVVGPAEVRDELLAELSEMAGE